MVATEERIRAEDNVENAAVEAKKQEIRLVVGGNDREEIRRKFNEDENSATQALETMNARAGTKNPIIIQGAFEGRVGNVTTLKHHVKMTEVYVKEIVNAYKTSPHLIPVAADTASGRTLNNLLNSIVSPENEINNQTAPYIYKIVQQAVNDRVANPLNVLSVDELRHLDTLSNTLHEKVVQTLAQSARNSGIDAGEIERFERREARNIERGGDSDFEQEWTRGSLKTYYEEKDTALLKAIYDVREFGRFIDAERNRIGEELESLRRRGQVIDPNELDRRLSEDIHTKIVLLFSKLYRKVDFEDPTAPMDETTRKGIYNSIETVSVTLMSKLNQLVDKIEEGGVDVPANLRAVNFYKLFTEEYLDEKEVVIDGKPVMRQQIRMIPAAQSTVVDAKEFMSAIYHQVGNEIETKGYLHNTGFIFSNPASKDGGFWSQVASYADHNMKSAEIDNITNLPDRDIFMTGFRLYTKYVEEAFAQVDWVHQPNMFSADFGENYTKIEKRVYEDLAKMFPDRVGGDEWRLRRAMTIAKGLARGVLFSGVEDESWADPALDEKGNPSYGSYGRNDSAAYNALNPLHHFLRWQSEQVGNMPLVFCPVSGVDPNFYRNYDHRVLWDLMKKYKETFLKGNEALREKNPNQRLFMEILINVARMGGLQSRGGWRYQHAYEGWTHYKSTEDSTRKRSALNYTETWKSIENIGYEVLFDFVIRKAGDDLLLEAPSDEKVRENTQKALKAEVEKEVDAEIKAGRVGRRDRERVIRERIEAKLPDKLNKSLRENTENRTDRAKFFRYIYKKYLNPALRGADDNTIDQALEAERNRLRPEVQQVIDEFIKKGIIQEADRENEITKEINRRLMFRTLIGVARDRMPTKFVRIERDRFTKDGERAWLKLKNALGWSNEVMDEAMKNLSLVETKIREEISEEMRLHLRTRNTLNDFVTDHYVVNEERIRRILGGITGVNVDNAVNLHRKIMENYFNQEEFIKELAEKIRPNNAAGQLRDRDFPFALGTEELDPSFLAYRNSGPRTLARAVGEISQAETIVFKNISEMMPLLLKMATDEKHDISQICEKIQAISTMMEGIHGKDVAYKLVHDLSMMVITFFKKDAAATGMFSKFFRTGQFNSLAARFTGLNHGVWEWDEIDIRNFVVELEKRRAIAKDPFDYGKEATYIQKPVKIFGLKLGEIKVRKPDYEFFGGKLSKDAGADNLQLAKGAFNKYFLIFWAILLFQYMRKALKEAEGGKQ